MTTNLHHTTACKTMIPPCSTSQRPRIPEKMEHGGSLSLLRKHDRFVPGNAEPKRNDVWSAVDMANSTRPRYRSIHSCLPTTFEAINTKRTIGKARGRELTKEEQLGCESGSSDSRYAPSASSCEYETPRPLAPSSEEIVFQPSCVRDNPFLKQVDGLLSLLNSSTTFVGTIDVNHHGDYLQTASSDAGPPPKKRKLSKDT
jgi:hypothetical protein